LPRFARVHTAYASPEGAARVYQIDLYGEPQSPAAPHWAVEVKNWARPVGRPEVEHFLQAAEHLRQERGLTRLVRWFYARSGFTAPAEELLKREGLLYSTEDDLLRLLHDLRLLDRWEDKGE
ncbi:MAG TPA: hypothetical protein ENK17_02145, partial [Anaerolineae bacterium]|nr:hypothetical protein [Anaerolineae bacterium]